MFFSYRQDRRSSVPDLMLDLTTSDRSEDPRPATNGFPSRPAWPQPSGPPGPLSLGDGTGDRC